MEDHVYNNQMVVSVYLLCWLRYSLQVRRPRFRRWPREPHKSKIKGNTNKLSLRQPTPVVFWDKLAMKGRKNMFLGPLFSYVLVSCREFNKSITNVAMDYSLVEPKPRITFFWELLKITAPRRTETSSAESVAFRWTRNYDFLRDKILRKEWPFRRNWAGVSFQSLVRFQEAILESTIETTEFWFPGIEGKIFAIHEHFAEARLALKVNKWAHWRGWIGLDDFLNNLAYLCWGKVSPHQRDNRFLFPVQVWK